METSNIVKQVDEAVKVLRAGGIMLYPTDTVWGIGCDAENAEAVKKIYDLKQRSDSKSMLVLVDRVERILSYIHTMPEIAYSLLEVTDTPLTIIYPGARNLAPNLVPTENTIGIRVVNHEFCERVIKKLNRPLVSTSANISGKPAPAYFEEISNEIVKGVDYVVSQEFEGMPTGKPSSIIMLGLNGEVKIIRE